MRNRKKEGESKVKNYNYINPNVKFNLSIVYICYNLISVSFIVIC